MQHDSWSMCLGRRWSTVVLRTAWHSQLHPNRQDAGARSGPCVDWPPSSSRSWVVDNHPFGHKAIHLDVAELSADVCGNLLQDLRHWGPRILDASSGPDERVGEEASLQHFARTLEGWKRQLLWAKGHLLDRSDASRFQHESEKLLECVLLSRSLHTRAQQLTPLIVKGVEMSVPPFLAATICQQMQSKASSFSTNTCRLPSRTKLLRHELSLDMALVGVCRELSESLRCCRYGWADSSPLAGHDWFWSQEVLIKESDIIPTFRAFHGPTPKQAKV